jgi:signal transduction histidine kinase
LLRSEKLASVGRMASTIAHEINNPLETIGHAVYLALTDPGTSQQAKSYLDLATQELERVTHITKQTLAFNREDKTPTLIDLRASIDSIVKLYAPRLKSRGITVEKRYAEVECIRAGGGEIQQVISNLLSNSMDATPSHGRIELRVSRSIWSNGSRLVRFTIADTGSGSSNVVAPRSASVIIQIFVSSASSYADSSRTLYRGFFSHGELL